MHSSPSLDVVVIAGYFLVVLLISWGESRLLTTLQLGSKISALVYAIPVNLIMAVIAPIAFLAAMAAGMIGVFGAINNTEGITTEQAFRSVAMPVAWISTALLLIVRSIPLVLMNLRSFFKALAYAIISCALLNILFIALGMLAFTALSDGSTTPPVSR
jgi:succinate dehydrogenase/fumarate reductase cytochrome b subunit